MDVLYTGHSFQEILMIFATALGCGLLIGLERERHHFQEKTIVFSGLRSFALCSVLGTVCFSFGIEVGIVGAILVGCIVVYSLWSQKDDIGTTTEFALILSYFIGAMCWWNIAIAASLAVVITIILFTKQSLHGFASQWVTDAELKDGILLLALILIALPLMPNQPLWGNVLNPYLILRLLILILVVQSLAHLAKRLLSSKNALLLSAFASGFVSSTATIASLGLQVRKRPELAQGYACAALASCVATLVQLLLIVAGINWVWLKQITLPILLGIIVLCSGVFWLMKMAKNEISVTAPTELNADSQMFSLKQASMIVVALTVIQVVVYGLSLVLGKAGLIVGTVLSSLFEVHAALTAIVVQGSPTANQSIYLVAFMIGLAVHAVSKCINAIISGGGKYALYFALVQIAHMSVVIGTLWLLA